MANRTYFCGDAPLAGLVKRLDNFLGPWVDISVPGIKTLYDVETNPDDPDHVIVVGRNCEIRVSTDAGVTWNTPGGSYTTLVPPPELYEVTWSDPNTIHTVGSGGACFISTDGGLTFDPTNTFPTVSGAYSYSLGAAYCVHFPTPLMGVAAFEDRVFKTIDGGNTWTQTNGGLPINNPQAILRFRGIHISGDGLTINAWGEGGVYRSTDGGATYSFTLDFLYVGGLQARPGEHLTWVDDNNLWGTTRQNEIFMSTNQGASWTLLNTANTSSLDVARVRAAHFYTINDGFHSVNLEMFETNDSGATSFLSDIAVGEIWAVWTALERQCYKLTSCTNGSVIITMTNFSAFLGQYVAYGDCYFVELSDTCIGAVILGIGPPVFETCAECVPLSCYILTPCEGTTGPELYVRGTFTIGTVVTIQEFPGCFQVTGIITPCEIATTVTVIETYPDCECCADYQDTSDLIPVVAGRVTYSCGENNCVRVSEDEGATWVSRNVPASPAATMMDIMAFPSNADKAVTVGTLGHIYLTQDRGVTWTESSPVATPGTVYVFEEVWHVDALNSFAVGHSIPAPGFGQPRFFRSTDGGLSYIDVPIVDTTGQVPFKVAKVISVHFVSPMVGVIGVHGTQDPVLVGYPPPTGVDQVWVLITNDGGDSWEVTNGKLPINAALPQGTRPWAIKMSVIPGFYIINLSVDAGNNIYRSTDSGLSYSPINVGSPTVHLTWIGDTYTWTNLTGVIYGIDLSTNIGISWTSQQTWIPTEVPYAGHFYDTGLAITGFYSRDETLYKSTNLGVSGVISDTHPDDLIIYAVWTEAQINYIPGPERIEEEAITQYIQPYIRQYYRLSDDQCTIDTNSSFADVFYTKFKQVKYSFKICPVDPDKWWIRKTLLDIRALGIDLPCCPPFEDETPTDEDNMLDCVA